MAQHPILCCVATEKGDAVLRAINENVADIQLHVCTFRETKVIERFDDKIRAYARENNLPVHSWKDIRGAGVNWLRSRKISAVVCVGWRYLLSAEMIDYLQGRILVTHDSNLPRYRGFAPLASAFINGEKEVGVTVMLASEQIDTGDIVYQGRVAVSLNDTMASLTHKVLPLFAEGIVSSLQKLLGGDLVGIPQDHSQATYSIWRDEEDLWIDWSESSERIDRVIRALGPPYMGARTRMGTETVIIQQAQLVPDLRFEIRQHGKVWSLSSRGEPTVICGSGMLLICRATIDDHSIIPMNTLRVRFH